MFRKLGFLVVVVSMVVVSMALPAWSGTVSGALSGVISGYVRDGSRAPQMGAAVEILGSAAQALETLKVFTDDRGFYSVASLLPGTYSVKVSAPSFLPPDAARENRRSRRREADGECHVNHAVRGHPAGSLAESGGR